MKAIHLFLAAVVLILLAAAHAEPFAIRVGHFPNITHAQGVIVIGLLADKILFSSPFERFMHRRWGTARA
jgi:hypothetical protein